MVDGDPDDAHPADSTGPARADPSTVGEIATHSSSARIRRDLALLRGLAEDDALADGLGVVALADRLGRERSQVSRALRQLRAAGLVERDDDGRHHLGIELFALAARGADSRLHRLATPILGALAVALDETAHLCVLHGHRVLTLRSVAPPTHAFRTDWEGADVPAARTSAGRVLLADSPRELVRRWFADQDLGIPPPDGATHAIAGIDDLLAAIDDARRRGYAIVDQELEAGLAGASAPVRDFRGDVVAALNVSAPADRLRPRLEAAARVCAAHADQLSRLLGAPPSRRPPRPRDAV